jgi:hypothetical protein
MPKDKGTPGGNLIKLSEEEYQKIVLFRRNKYDPHKDTSLTPKERQTFKNRASKFVLVDDEVFIKTYSMSPFLEPREGDLYRVEKPTKS